MVIAVDIPDELKAELEQRAQAIFGPGGLNDAVMAAIRLWLTQTEQDLVATERRLNNAAYQRLRDQLERDYAGKYAVIAHGELQTVVDSPEEARNIARDAHHRLVFKIGDHPPKKRSLGWKIQRKARNSSAGTTPPASS
ncbi:MAG: hypothetical protein ACE5MB_03975 [Anaerolineae bacterium]